MTTTHRLSAFSRREFLKIGAGALPVIAAGEVRGWAAGEHDRIAIALVVPPDDPIAAAPPSTWAIGELETALVATGASVRRVRRLTEMHERESRVVIGGCDAPLVAEILKQRKLAAPADAESLCLVRGEIDGAPALIAGGRDPRGLVYCLTELADRAVCLGAAPAALDLRQPVIERPASRTRSVMRAFCSESEDKPWFYDRDYWRNYLTMLAASRFNRLNLVLGMGYNSAHGISDGYFVFPYPFLVAVPGYHVSVEGLPEHERVRNLEALRFIGEAATRRGVRFQLGVWTLAHKWPQSPQATYRITGLGSTNHAAYCRDALALLLREVPTIGGVTFRVHSESGIAHGSDDFWKMQFDAIARCGRRVELDMHAKNMEAQTLAAALATGQPVVVSPKYCGEHLGLPYHPAAIRERERRGADRLTDPGSGLLVGNRLFTRYGYADMLSEGRPWDVVFRIWPGTQRFLLHGDPLLFAGYARNASFCGAAGIEWAEPLFFKGRLGSEQPGGRCAYADETLNPPRDFEKYRYTYRLWGRLGYNPDAEPDVWRRALRHEFGAAASAVEGTLAAATRVLPLVTLAHAPSADCQSYWPDIYTNQPVADSTRPSPYGDTAEPKLFGNVSPFDPQLFQSPDECADALLAGHAVAKYSPLEVAQWLDELAATVAKELEAARTRLGAPAVAPAFRRVEEDSLIQCGLALFFAAKLRSAVLWRIHVQTGDRGAAHSAVDRMAEARDAWVAMAKRAGKVYRPNIAYGRGKVQGHWLDRVAAIEEDLADLRRRAAMAPAASGPFDAAAGQRAAAAANAKVDRSILTPRHVPPAQFRNGQPLVITLRCDATTPAPQRAVLHYRHVNQAESWLAIEMARSGDALAGEIPATYTASRFAIQYYFEVDVGRAQAALVPGLAADLANAPYFVVRRGP